MSDRTSEYRIHTYTAAEAGLFVNSYLVETTEGVVLVDANLLLSDIRALAARIAALHKPLLGVFVTHAHPDHFNGLPVLAGDEVPVYPDRRLSAGDVVELGGLRFTLHAVGAAESHADSYLTLGDRAFIGDLAFHGIHSYTADGHTGSWLAALDMLTGALDGATLYPGHGATGDVGMLADQRRYLMMYRETVGRLAAGAPTLTDARRERLTAVMTRFLPGAPLTWMIGLGADAVAAELAGEVTGAAGTASTEAVAA